MEGNEHFYTHLHFLKRFKGELPEMYVSAGLRAFARSLISIFVPLYLLKLGYSLPIVFAVFATHNLFHALFVIPATRFICRVGIKRTILISKFFEVAYYLLLYTLDGSEFWFLFFIPFIYGIHRALYYTAFHLDLSTATKSGKRGSEIGALKFTSALFAVAAPTVGGFLLLYFGFQWVFLVAAMLLVASALPLFFTPEITPEYKLNIRTLFRKERMRDMLAWIGFGIESGAAGTIWSIFLFLNIVTSFGTLGVIATTAKGISLAANLIVGKITDKNTKGTMRTGSILSSIASWVRGLASATGHAFALNAFSGISRKLLYIPVGSITYQRAHGDEMVSYIVFREIVINAARGLLYIGMMFAATLVAGFIAGAIGSLLFLLL